MRPRALVLNSALRRSGRVTRTPTAWRLYSDFTAADLAWLDAHP
ncbi:MAG: hypothetical protein AB1730_13910 [Myxococcota bacterium]